MNETENRTVFGNDTNVDKSAIYHLLCEPTETPNKKNIAISVGKPNQDGWEKTGHVVLTKDEARQFIEALQREIGDVQGEAAGYVLAYSAEAGETFQNDLLLHVGHTVEITPREPGEHHDMMPFDAVLVGVGDGWYDKVVVRAYNEDIGEAEGEPFEVFVDRVFIH